MAVYQGNQIAGISDWVAFHFPAKISTVLYPPSFLEKHNCELKALER
jgi:hypothetical protein